LEKPKGVFSLIVIVAALGYFVDLYDLVLFGVVRDASLKSLGLSGQVLREASISLFNFQMAGFLIGGIVWGIFGDIKGRLSVLFGTIILYSAANIANGFVNDLTSYSILRFIAGIGLAGELGVGITLVSESLPIKKRTLGTMLVVAFGALGAVLAAQVGNMGWRTAYFVGGGLGFVLLFLRIGTHESAIYKNISNSNVSKGSFHQLFTSKERFLKYLGCICIGLPVWFALGVLTFNANDFAAVIGVKGTVVIGKCIMFSYLGLTTGDICCGLLSYVLKSRRKAILIFLSTSIISFTWYMLVRDISLGYFYFLMFMLGTLTGYWAIFVTIAAEQFGTNLRATVTTTVPNFVRGATVPITLSYVALQKNLGVLYSASIVGAVCLGLALISIISIKETFFKDLDYIEELNKSTKSK